MKVKNILMLLFVIVSVISVITLVFQKNQKLIIRDIDSFAFNDSIIFIHDYKDENGPGIETKVKGYDTPFCFSGINHQLNLLYLDYAKKGDVIIKTKNADSFYIIRKDSALGFLLNKCQ